MARPHTFPEDLIDLIIAADAIRRQALGMNPTRYRPSQRRWIEPWFNALGRLFGFLQSLLPWTIRRRLDRWMCVKMGGHAAEEHPGLSTRLTQTSDLAKRLAAETGEWPATMILTSHPETIGPLQWLRFEVLRLGLEIAGAVVDARPNAGLWREHPVCFLAIDPYALDTVSPAVGGFYAAWMHQIYLAWDRQPSTQSWIQRYILLRGSGYDRVAWRILGHLRRDIPVLMMLPGGLPHNARLLYTAREWVQRLPLNHWPVSKRTAERNVMELLMRTVNGLRPPENGELPPETETALVGLLGSWGVPNPAETVRAWSTEFRLAVPYRERWFHILLERLVRKGKPLILNAVSHYRVAPHARTSDSWGVYQDKTGQLMLIRGNEPPVLTDAKELGKSFAAQYI